MLLTRKSGTLPGGTTSSPFVHSLQRGLSAALPTMDRRGFLRRSGLGVGVGLAASQLTLVKKARAAGSGPGVGDGKIEVKRTVCTHCSVGCAIDAVVENGVWTRQEPVFDSPINLGAHCAKGAAIREHGHGEYRLRYPMKLVNGKYQRISWDQAYTEIAERPDGPAQGQRPRLRSTGSARPSTTTSSPTCCASSSASGAATTATTRRASATPPPWPAWPTRGVTAP
jgi:formate dehydrogenase major subunit